ncbi:MAG: type I 3-dehydroquinate dehydratase [bacterium]|nr:type I 3-dehydroquinate dehydratase [bacterium]
MNIRICTPVTGKTIDEFLSNLNKTQEVSGFVELRVDSIENVSESDIETISQNLTVESIFTCRKNSEGGMYGGDEKSRIMILEHALNQNFDFVDIELSTMEDYSFKKRTSKLIVSYHNFSHTPSYWDMQKIIATINSFNPDIIKISTMITQDYEVTKIYRLLTNKPHDEERIVIGMGEKGKMTRILGPLLGSYCTYASTKWGETAPGQIDIDEMKKVYTVLNPKS